MSNSLKIGIVSGLIVGFIAGAISAIVTTGAFIVAGIIKLPWGAANLPGVLTINFLTTHVFFEIMLNGSFGAIFGVIYSKLYDSLPGEGISKGFVYGLILFLASNFYAGVLYLERYGYIVIDLVIGTWWMGFFCLVSYGIVLGALYKRPTRTIGKYDLKQGISYGAVAGLIGGIAAIIAIIIGVNLGLWMPVPGILSATFLTTHHIFEVTIVILFGALFGVIYSRCYDSIPGKSIIKGLVYSMIIYLASSIRIGVLLESYEYANKAIVVLWLGFFTWIIYGLVLGYLYRKPLK